MGSSKPKRFFGLVLFAVMAIAAFPQAQPAKTVSDIKADEVKLYADAHPYLDESAPDLELAIPELHGLKAASNQDRLSSILDSTGSKVRELLQEVPNLICEETVSEAVSLQNGNGSDDGLPSGRLVGWGEKGDLRQDEARDTPKMQRFHYLVLVHEVDGERLLQEYRTDSKDRPIPQGPAAPKNIGFGSMWIVFSPANRNKSRFRYLGQQKIDGRLTFVVAFAQTPGEESHPGHIALPGGVAIPALHQGIAWVDESDFRILRLRTDLLAPQPQIGLQQLTSTVRFSSVRISKLAVQLWLPQQVKLNLAANGQVMQEDHQYSQYHMYKAEAKILTDAP